MRMGAVKIRLVVVLAMMWWSSSPATAQSGEEPGLAELGPCWLKIDDCVASHVNDTSNPMFDPSSPSFDQSEYLCCPLIQDTFKTDQPCFCTVSTLLHQNPNGPDFTDILSRCDTTSSLADFDAFCEGANPPAKAPKTTKLPLGGNTNDQTGTITSDNASKRSNKSGANRIDLATLIPSTLLLIWLTMLAI